MNLQAFLDLAVKSALTVTLKSPAGEVIATQPATALSAEEWEAFAKNDADGLPRRETPYAYKLEATRDEAGPKSLTSYVLRMHGGVATAAGETSDVVGVGNMRSQEAVAFKAAEAMAKQVVALSNQLVNRDRDEVRENREFTKDALTHARELLKEVRRLHGKMGEGDIVVQIAKAHADAEGRSRDNLASAIRGVAPLAAAIVTPMLPEGMQGKVGSGLLLATLRPEQLEGIYEILGVKRASALLTAKTREEMTSAVLALNGETELPRIMDLLDAGQRATVNRILDEVLKGAPTEAAAQ